MTKRFYEIGAAGLPTVILGGSDVKHAVRRYMADYPELNAVTVSAAWGERFALGVWERKDVFAAAARFAAASLR